MRERILALVQGLRARGVEVSVAEALDAVAAVAAAGVERDVLREALAACVVKDEANRPVFDRLFDEMFPTLAGASTEGRGRRARGPGGGETPTGSGRGGGSGAGARGRSREAPDDARPTARPDPRPRAERPETRHASLAERRGDPGEEQGSRGRAARRHELLTRPFEELTAADLEEARTIVRQLGARLHGRLARRLRSARHGRLDFRRTIRGAMSTGGLPLRPRLRARRPGRPDLVVLCDVSGSVAAASELLLGLVAPAAGCFRRVELFAYVDRLCSVSMEAGHVALGEPLDLYARSDFGRVLVELGSASSASSPARPCCSSSATRGTTVSRPGPTSFAPCATACSASFGSYRSHVRAGTRATA